MSAHPVFKMADGSVRALGRDTDATMKLWPQLISRAAIAPRIFSGAVPDKSPNISRYYHASFLSQRQRGYCVGFNTCGTFMTLLRIPPGATATSGDPLPLVQLSPLYTYDVARWQCERDGYNMGTQDGLIGSEAFIGAKNMGCVELEYYPSGPADIDHHVNGTKPPPAILEKGKEHILQEWAQAQSFSHGLELMAAGFPIALCSEIPSGMMQTDAKGFFRMAGNIVGGHCYSFYDYDKTTNRATIGQAWERWGEKTSDPHYQEMHGFTQLGTCPLDELEKWFAPNKMASGSSEIMVANMIEGFAPLIVDYSSM